MLRYTTEYEQTISATLVSGQSQARERAKVQDRARDQDQDQDTGEMEGRETK